jgi:hypothetical protein
MIRTLRLGIALAMVAAWPGMASSQQKPDEPKLGEEIQLFNGKNLDGWGFYLADPKLKMEDVWSVKDGILVCKGDPMGYLSSSNEFKDFKLVVQWRWAPGKEPGNSGVLMRITGEPKALPKCLEAQLKHGNAGDIWAFQGFTLKGDADRFQEVNHEKFGHLIGVKRIAEAEKPPGEWNQYAVMLDNGRLTLEINGQVVNYATDCDNVAGKIALQSEGGEVHFRTVKLMPILGAR